MGLERGPDGVVADHRRVLAGAVDGRGDQPLLDAQQLRGRPAALLHRPVGDHRHRPLGKEPVREFLKLSPGGTGELAAEGSDDVLAGEGGRLGGQAVRTGKPIQQFGHCPLGQGLVAVDRLAGHLPDEAVHIHAPSGRLRPPPSIQRVRRLLLFGVTGGVDGPLDQPRCPLTAGRL
jgi:hypothetical protein